MLIIRKYASLAFRMSTTFPVTLLNRVALRTTEGVKVASEGSFSVFFFLEELPGGETCRDRYGVSPCSCRAQGEKPNSRTARCLQT